MDFQKLALAAHIRSEVLRKMNKASIKSPPGIQEISHPDATYQEHVYDLLAEVIETAEMIDAHIASGGHLVKFN